MRKECLQALHQGHRGIVEMKLRAQSSMYQIELKKETEDHVMRCEPCQNVNRSQQKESAIPILIPNRPWNKLGVDIFSQGGKWYLLIADYY